MTTMQYVSSIKTLTGAFVNRDMRRNVMSKSKLDEVWKLDLDHLLTKYKDLGNTDAILSLEYIRNMIPHRENIYDTKYKLINGILKMDVTQNEILLKTQRPQSLDTHPNNIIRDHVSIILKHDKEMSKQKPIVIEQRQPLKQEEIIQFYNSKLEEVGKILNRPENQQSFISKLVEMKETLNKPMNQPFEDEFTIEFGEEDF